MSNEIRFKPSREYSNDTVLTRVANLVLRTDTWFEKDSGYRWTLGTSNNWFMDRDRKKGEFILAYRYGFGGNVPKMEALRKVIDWVFKGEAISKAIQFKSNPRYKDEDTARCVARIIVGADTVRKDESFEFYKGWLFGDSSNDWGLCKNDDTGKFCLLCSNERASTVPDIESALKTVIIWLLGLERFNSK